MIRRTAWKDVAWGEMDTLDQLVHLSRYYGSNPDFVLAGGGNTSAKMGDELYVKASGVEMANITREGFVCLSRERLARILTTPYPAEPMAREEEIKRDLLAARRGGLEAEGGQRPSVESVLHEIVKRRFVVHTHPTLVNGLTCSKEGKERAEQMFGEEALWVDYADPGHTLAKKVAGAIERYEKLAGRTPEIMLLQNHGLIIAADEVGKVKRLTDKVLRTIRRHSEGAASERAFPSARLIASVERREIIEHLAPVLRGMFAAQGLPRVVTYDDSSGAAFICSTWNKSLALGGALTPDQIVYCKSFPLWLARKPAESPEEMGRRMHKLLSGYVERFGYEPKVVLVEGAGVLAAGETPKMARSAKAVYLDAVKVMANAADSGGAKFLTARGRHFIETWESEQYRRKVATGEGSGRVRGKVVVITGAAQGLGEGMARDMAAEGAHVVIADTNLPGAQRVSDEINSLQGEGRAFAWRTDVTNGESVRELIHQVVREYGGIDVFISNAGILKAGSVKTMSDADFDLVTDINYQGYFHCVKYAAPVMAAQHNYNPGSWTDIIQVNSKSGLVGSNRNPAYAGSKFGGIGLTQSFALELVEDGIKVNSVCPGNIFDSPLWSDPDKGLFMQYLRTGKVPGAKTVEEVRKAYEAKIPMGRGCELADIMKAVYYLIEQKYETGQALPVTGGQVMLR